MREDSIMESMNWEFNTVLKYFHALPYIHIYRYCRDNSEIIKKYQRAHDERGIEIKRAMKAFVDGSLNGISLKELFEEELILTEKEIARCRAIIESNCKKIRQKENNDTHWFQKITITESPEDMIKKYDKHIQQQEDHKCEMQCYLDKLLSRLCPDEIDNSQTSFSLNFSHSNFFTNCSRNYNLLLWGEKQKRQTPLALSLVTPKNEENNNPLQKNILEENVQELSPTTPQEIMPTMSKESENDDSLLIDINDNMSKPVFFPDFLIKIGICFTGLFLFSAILKFIVNSLSDRNKADNQELINRISKSSITFIQTKETKPQLTGSSVKLSKDNVLTTTTIRR